MLRRRRLRFLPLAPAAVVFLGIATALIVALAGVGHLRAQSRAAAELRARVLSDTLAARLRATELEARPQIVERAARRSGAEVLLLRHDGEVLVDASLGAPDRDTLRDLMVSGNGTTNTKLGETRYWVTPLSPPLSHMAVVTFVRAPEAPFATSSLLFSVTALTAILVGAAALVALSIARDVRSDVEWVKERIVEMAREDAEPAGKLVPVRSIDQIGLLTSAFNVLVDRFTAAEHAYRQDLAGALAYDRDRSAFLAALSHELRTPLNAILGFTEVLLSEVDGPLSDESKENLGVVRSSGQHLRELIDDILELSALESGELELVRREIDVLPIAEEVVREARVGTQGKSLDIEVEGRSTAVWGDSRRIRQILGNVVGNAVKFTNAGSVRLSVEPEAGGWGVIRVTDTGPGIAPEDQAAIFEEYQQAGDATARKVGTGLGLAITRRLVQMHGGTVELESSIGLGSCFSIWLPRNPPEPPGAEDQP
jgi:signal transduction histidine kinase